jgi:hypothetical protein
MKKMFGSISDRLEELQDQRDRAIRREDETDIKKAQAELDEYFLKDPPKQKKKKKRKRPQSDEYGFDGEFMEDELNFIR